MNTLLYILVAVIILAPLFIRIMREYERAVVFTFGRFTGVKGPGLIIIIPVVQQIERVQLRTLVMDVPTQDVISRDNVSVKVNAVIYFRVLDAERGDHPGRGLPRGDQPARPDHLALGAWPA